MSEPCPHERAGASDEIRSFVSAIQSLVRVEAERDAALARIVRVQALVNKWSDDYVQRIQTHDDRDDRADARDDCATEIEATLADPSREDS